MDKLIKLMALSKSSNANEAALAIDKANQLREKFDIKDTDFIIHDEFESAASVLPIWQKMFLGAVSELYGTMAVVKKSRNLLGKHKTLISFTGEELDVFFCKEMFAYLCDTMTRAKKVAWYSKDPAKQVRGKQAVNNFAIAFASEICSRLSAMGDKASWAPARSSKKAAAKKYLVEITGRELATSRARAVVRGSAGLSQGKEAGASVNLGKQMNGGEELLRLSC